MTEIDSFLFLMVNATAASPAWVLSLARAVTLELPQAVFAGMVGAACFMNTRQRQDLLAVLVTLLLAWVCARLIQHVFPMPRPFALGIGTSWLQRAPTAGFPSTHSTVAFAFAVAVSLRSGWSPLAGAALVLAALVAWSRICLGLHFPSQAAAGALLGAACAWVVYRGQGGTRTSRRGAPHATGHGKQILESGTTPPGRS